MTVSNHRKSVVTYYDQLSSDYASRYGHIIPKTGYINKAFSYLTKSNPRVVEIGSGSGCDAREILQNTLDYLGFDISEKMINLSCQNVPQAKFILADAESCELPMNIDIIFAFSSLFHLGQIRLKKLLSRLYRHLSPGGVIVISTKEDDYHSIVERVYGQNLKTYFYNLSTIQKLTPRGLAVIYNDSKVYGIQKWLCVMFQKPLTTSQSK